jgi:glutaredoxin-like protein NrdH
MADRVLNQDSVIILYSLQSCSHCKDTKQYLEQLNISFKTIYVDMLLGDERGETLRQLRRFNPGVSFPTLVIGNKAIIGFKKDDINSALYQL